MTCTACQTSLPPDALFCPWCGTFAGTVATGPTQRLPPLTMHPSAAADPHCPKCRHLMQRGFLPDFDDRTGGEPGFWVAGEPKRNPRTKRVIVRTNAMYAVIAYRCSGCGYVELYAPQQIGSDA